MKRAICPSKKRRLLGPIPNAYKLRLIPSTPISTPRLSLTLNISTTLSMRIACPNTSSVHITGASSGSMIKNVRVKSFDCSKSLTSALGCQQGKRLQSLKRENKLHDVHEARKKKEMREKAQARKSPIFEIRAVYVGNVSVPCTLQNLDLFKSSSLYPQSPENALKMFSSSVAPS